MASFVRIYFLKISVKPGDYLCLSISRTNDFFESLKGNTKIQWLDRMRSHTGRANNYITYTWNTEKPVWKYRRAFSFGRRKQDALRNQQDPPPRHPQFIGFGNFVVLAYSVIL